jgi:hypothetical protein
MPNSRAQRYLRLLREVGRELNEKPTSEMVKHVATLRLMRENLQIRLLAGERINPADVLALDAALKQYLPQGKPIKVEIEIVDSVPQRDPPPPPPDPPAAPAPTSSADDRLRSMYDSLNNAIQWGLIK